MWNEKDFCDADSGFDYIFGMMNAIYGSKFINHWQDVDPMLVRETWKKYLGRFLTYKPSLDFALEKLGKDFPPSAIAFRDLCNQGPEIPVKQVLQIDKQSTEAEKQAALEAKEKAKKWLDKHKWNKNVPL